MDKIEDVGLVAVTKEILEALDLPIQFWDYFYPPPVDDRDSTRRISFNIFTHDGWFAGGTRAYPKSDREYIDQETGTPTTKAMTEMLRHFLFAALSSATPRRDFIGLACRIWKPDKGFLRCYIEWWADDRAWKIKRWLKHKRITWILRYQRIRDLTRR